jgi:signal peptidase
MTDGDEDRPTDAGDSSTDPSKGSGGGESGTGASAPHPEEEIGEWGLLVRDVAVSVTSVLLLGGFILAMSGVLPPMVAIESGSMEPNMEVNDLVFVMDTDRFEPGQAHNDTGVVPAAGAESYGQFGNQGDVIVFEPNGNQRRTRIIHRAMFWVDEGENWCEHPDADPAFIGRTDDLRCEAPHDGFITKGDSNPTYDQVGGQATEPVKPEWIVGTAEVRLPGLGWFSRQF